VWLPRVVTVAPASEPVSVAEAKAHCRVDDSSSDTLIGSLITAARSHVEQVTGLAIMAQTLDLRCSRWTDLQRLPAAPITTVNSVQYLDASATLQTLDPAQYAFVGANALRASIEPVPNAVWPSLYSLWPMGARSDAIKVVAVAGFATVPEPLRVAVLMLVAQWFEYREGVAVDVRGIPTELPHAVEALLTNYRLNA
jgi:uncharacterized phiE125 gp8 family phage protein